MRSLDPDLDQHFAGPLLAQLAALGSSGHRPVVGLNGPVGAGKTTLSRLLLHRADAQGLRLAVASIDDFYLPWEARLTALAGNPFGVTRVLPGSHDIPLALAFIDSWQQGANLRLPRFDKSLRCGQGDRAGEQLVEADVLLLEGWLLGCQPLARQRSPWDGALLAYLPLWRRFSQLHVLRPLRWTLPRRWRFQAEARQRKQGKAWLPAEELDKVVNASLGSLPPELYQDPLISQATGYAILDGRRRWVGGSRLDEVG